MKRQDGQDKRYIRCITEIRIYGGLVQKHERKRISERPRRRWKDCIKTVLNGLGWGK